jgi:hypothetical protein
MPNECKKNKKSPPVFANHEVTHHNARARARTHAPPHTHTPPITLVFILFLRVITSFAVTTVGRGNAKCYELDYIKAQNEPGWFNKYSDQTTGQMT